MDKAEDPSFEYLDRFQSWAVQLDMLDQAFLALDLDKDGYISWRELQIAAIQTKVVAVEARMREMFRRCRGPNARDNKIRVDDLVHVLQISPEEANQLISEADGDHNREVDYEEFLDMWRANARRVPSDF